MMPLEEGHPLAHPRVEPAVDVLRDLTDDVRAILEPLQFGARRRRPDGLFTFFAMVAVLHDDSGRFAGMRCGTQEKNRTPGLRRGPYSLDQTLEV